MFPASAGQTNATLLFAPENKGNVVMNDFGSKFDDHQNFLQRYTQLHLTSSNIIQQGGKIVSHVEFIIGEWC